MEYQKIINLLDNTSNSHLNTGHWVEINDDSCSMYYTNSQSRFETPMLKSSLNMIIVIHIYFLEELY